MVMKKRAGLVPAPRWPVFLVACLAVNRPTFRRLERNLGLSSAVGANYIVHFSWLSVVSVHN